MHKNTQELACGSESVLSFTQLLLGLCSLYCLYVCLQACLRQVVHGVGGLDHFEWRHFNNQRQKKPPRGFVDGDLIEQYLDLDRQTMQQVATMMCDTTVEDLSKTVEEMARLH